MGAPAGLQDVCAFALGDVKGVRAICAAPTGPRSALAQAFGAGAVSRARLRPWVGAPACAIRELCDARMIAPRDRIEAFD